MAQKQNQKKRKQKLDYHKIVVAVLALLMAVLMLLPMVTMVLGNALAVTQSEIDALKSKQSEYKNKLAGLKNELAELKDDQNKAEQQRKILMQQLEAIDAEISNINAQIAYYDGEISQKEAERVEAVAREEAQYDLFCKRVRSMEEDGNLSYWSILFSAEDFSDLLDRAMVVNDVMDYDNAIMDQLVATRKQIEQLKADLETARAGQEDAKAQQEARRQDQAAKVKEAQALLEQINANAAEVNRQLDAENAEMAKVNSEIAKKQKELEAQRKKNNVVLNTGSSYHWPLPGRYRLTSAFGYRIHPITGKAHSHTGIDIPAPGGTPIHAAKGGQVVTSARHSSYGNYVVIDHGNGNSTLYAHMSSRAVAVGDIVSQDQVIGYVGTTGSSTGNHLHLEVRDNYQRVNPEAKYPGLSFDRAYNR